MVQTKKTKILIVGAGKGSIFLIDLFSESKSVKIVGVVDINKKAPGILLAKKSGIPVSMDYKRFIRGKKIDEIINITGSERVQKDLMGIRLGKIDVIGYPGAKFLWGLVDEHRQMGEKLRASEEKYKTVFEFSPEAIVLLDASGKVKDLNGRVFDWLGYKPKEILNKEVGKLPFFDKESKKIAVKNFKERVKGENIGPYEIDFISKKGKRRVGRLYATLIKDDRGKVLGDLVVISNVTDKQEAEEKLIKSEMKYRTFYGVSSDAIMTLEPFGKFLEANLATLKLFGCKKESEFVLKSPAAFSPRYQLDGQLSSVKAKKVMQKAMDEGSHLFEWLHKKKNGKEFSATVLLTKMKIQGKEVLQATVRDVTEKTRAENELKRLKQQVEYILGATKTGLDIIDRQYNIHYVDPEWMKIYGEPKGRKCYEYFMGRKKKCSSCGIGIALKEKKAVVSEEVLTKENNRIVQVTTIPYKNEDGEWLVAEVKTDITERKKTEKNIQRQKALLDNVISHIPHFVFWKNKDLEYLGCNENFARVAGVKSPEDIKEKTDYDLAWKKEETEYFRKCDNIVLKTGEPMLDIEESQLQANGREAVLLTSKVPVKDADGKVTGILGIYSDITERKNTENNLRNSEDRYRTIFENTGAAMVILEENMVVSMMNAEFEKLFGYKKEEIENKRTFLEFIEEEYVDAVVGYHKLRMLDPGATPRNYEIKCIDKDGKIRDVYLTIDIIPTTKRSVVSLLDITELRRKEIELNKQKELLNNTNQALENKLKELQEAAGHINKLEGLVPICAKCKKMRLEDHDPKDVRSWVPLEKYISERSDASFTHGLCPECLDEVYGKKGRKTKKKTKKRK